MRNRIHLGDFLELGQPADYYDLVFGLDIFEHLNPNRLEAYVQRIFEVLTCGGYLFCNIPAFGPDPIFGNLFPLYLETWEKDAAENRPFRTIHADEWGYPVNGHLIWADSLWWVRQMEGDGFLREVDIEQALHQKYDVYFKDAAPARKAFYVFSKKGNRKKSGEISQGISSTPSLALKNREILPLLTETFSAKQVIFSASLFSP